MVLSSVRRAERACPVYRLDNQALTYILQHAQLGLYRCTGLFNTLTFFMYIACMALIQYSIIGVTNMHMETQFRWQVVCYLLQLHAAGLCSVHCLALALTSCHLPHFSVPCNSMNA